MQYRQLGRGLTLSASAIALVALLGSAPAHQASAQGTQGYSGNQNGGSATMNGTGTRGEDHATGSGVGGPRDPARVNNGNRSNTTNDPNLATGRQGTPSSNRPSDPADANSNKDSQIRR